MLNGYTKLEVKRSRCSCDILCWRIKQSDWLEELWCHTARTIFFLATRFSQEIKKQLEFSHSRERSTHQWFRFFWKFWKSHFAPCWSAYSSFVAKLSWKKIFVIFEKIFVFYKIYIICRKKCFYMEKKFNIEKNFYWKKTILQRKI